MNSIFYKLSFLLFPKRCGVCNDVINIRNDYCINCEKKLRRVSDYHAGIFAENNKFFTKFTKPYFDSISAPFYLEDGSKDLIYNYKFNNRSELKIPISSEMLTIYNSYLKNKNIDIIVGVPTMKYSKYNRGYDQVKLLSVLISKSLGIPYIPALKQIKKKKTQHTLGSQTERLKNVLGIYDIKNIVVKDKIILLIDDIVTTGATVNECSKVLKKHGAKEVHVLCAAINM